MVALLFVLQPANGNVCFAAMGLKDSGKLSQSDVAQLAKVSTATVSRVLNNSTLLAPETRERVLRVAQELGYKPDLRFRSMAQARRKRPRLTGTFGLLLRTSASEFVADPYQQRLFWSIERAARECEQHILVSSVETNSAHYLPDFVMDMKVDGMLVVDYRTDDFLTRLQALTPVVQVNARPQHAQISAVMPDEASGIVKALDYLQSLGHRRIYYFDIRDSVLMPNAHHEERTQAFAQYSQALGLGEARSLVLRERTQTMLQTARAHLEQWQAERQFPTALVCGADYYAIGFLEAAEELGIQVPRQLSVIGCDDIEMCEHTRPKLTSIRQPIEMIGAAAVRMLLEQLDGMPAAKSTRRFDVTLVPRQSCQAAGEVLPA